MRTLIRTLALAVTIAGVFSAAEFLVQNRQISRCVSEVPDEIPEAELRATCTERHRSLERIVTHGLAFVGFVVLLKGANAVRPRPIEEGLHRVRLPVWSRRFRWRFWAVAGLWLVSFFAAIFSVSIRFGQDNLSREPWMVPLIASSIGLLLGSTTILAFWIARYREGSIRTDLPGANHHT